jgi:methionyl-tRNA formyltransferase
VHSSLLPKYRGASPIHSAILNGDTETGVSIMYIEEELDAGDVILKEYCSISEEDTLGTLHDRLKELGAAGLEKALKLIREGKVQAEKQDETEVSFVKPITKEQTRINWNDMKETIYNQIRGLNPFPGAHTYTETGENVKIYRSEKIDKEYAGENGSVVEIINKKGPVVKTSNGGIILLEVKFEGKKLQSGTDIINGRKLTIGNKFEN